MTTRFHRELPYAHRSRSSAELAAAGVTRARLRGRRWRQTSFGFYAPSGSEAATPTQRILDAAPLVPPGGALMGWAAAFVLGADMLDGLDDVTMQPQPIAILLGRDVGRRDHSGVVYRRDRLVGGDRTTVEQVPVTTPERTVFDLARLAPTFTAGVVAIEAAGAALGLGLPSMRLFCGQHPGWTGVPQVRTALALADLGSRSTWETRLRLCYQLEAGLPRPLVNQPVFDQHGDLLGIPDLLDPAVGLAVEFDGQDHRLREQHRSDNVREERLEGAGLVVARADSLDLRYHRRELISRLRARHGQAQRQQLRLRTWTLDAPDWWTRRRAA